MSRWIVLFGLLVVVFGLILHFKAEIPWLTSWIGKLPGDITIQKGNLTIYIPVATSLIVSVVLSLLLSLFFKPSK